MNTLKKFFVVAWLISVLFACTNANEKQPIMEITHIEFVTLDNGKVDMVVEGNTNSGGWTEPELVQYLYIQPPAPPKTACMTSIFSPCRPRVPAIKPLPQLKQHSHSTPLAMILPGSGCTVKTMPWKHCMSLRKNPTPNLSGRFPIFSWVFSKAGLPNSVSMPRALREAAAGGIPD